MRGRGIRLAAALAVALLVALAVKQAAAAPNAVELQAREAFAAGRYDEALELFAKLYAETLHPVYLRNIGRCHQKMREPQKAIDAFQDYLAKEKKISADERKEIQGYIKEMEALRDEQARPPQPAAPVAPPLPATPAPATPPQPATPAPVAPAPAPPPAPYPQPVTPLGQPQTGAPQPEYAVPAGYYPPAADLQASQPLPPPAQHSTPVYKKWWFWTLIGVVVAGTVVAVAVASSGAVKPDCPPDALGGCK